MKIDFKKELKHLYNPPSEKVVIVDVPKMNFLMIEGIGDPNTSKEYRDALEALFGVSYAIKFMIKKQKAADYAVMPLEGLWWVDDMTKFSVEDKAALKWKSMIMQPEYVTEDMVDTALEQTQKKKNLPALFKLRFEAFQEGLSAQIMHVGPFSAEGPTIEKIHNFMRTRGNVLTGRHHEIYLSDPRKSAPEKMKTILRQPMKSSEQRPNSRPTSETPFL
jgi:hypothetical protein